MSTPFDDKTLPAVIAGSPRTEREDVRPAGRGRAKPRDQAFSAQVMGQDGQKRGLRGGPPVLEGARAAYLEAEWSGPDDRRLAAGRIMKVTL